MKKMMTAAALMAAMTVIGATAAMAETVDKVDVQGIKFEIPEEVRDLVTVQTEGLEDGTYVSVAETASIEAAEEMGEDVHGPGMLFTISAVSEDEMKKIRCEMSEGREIFAEDDGVYYVFNHPTDVRLVRASNEEMDAAMDDWRMLNEWANGTVRDEILANNPELEPKNYSHTALDGYLCMAAYQPDTKFEVKSLEFGGETPEVKFADEYLEDLTEGVTYENIEEEDAGIVEGETIVLNFPELATRFDFIKDNENVIREVHVLNDGEEEYCSYIKATFEDDDKTATGIMQEWVDAILNDSETEDDD